MLFIQRNSIVLSLCLFYLITSLFSIEANAIAGDEPFSIYFSGQPYSKIWAELFTGNNPPLYEFVLKTISTIFGQTVLVFRLPSLLFATATLYLFFQFLKSHFSIQSAVFFGLMYCFSDYFITFSLEARGYSMLNFLVCTAVILYFKGFLEKSNTAKIGLILVNCLLLLTHYLSALFITVQVLAILLSPEIKNKIKNILIYYGVTLLIMSPLILNVVLKMFTQKEISAWPGPPEGITDMYNTIWRFSNKPVIAVLIIALLLVVPSIIYWRGKSIKFSGKIIFLILWFPLLFVGMYFLSFKIPMFIDRYLIILSLGFYAVLSILLTKLFTDTKKNWIFGLSLALLFLSTHRWVIDNKRPLDKIAHWIQSNKEEDNTQIVLSDYQMLHGMAYHTNKSCFFESTTKKGDLHLLRCLSKQNIGFDFNNARTLLVIEQGKELNTSIQEKINDQAYLLLKEDFFPEFYTLKILSKRERTHNLLDSK